MNEMSHNHRCLPGGLKDFLYRVQNSGHLKPQFDYSMKSHYLNTLERNDLS